MGTDSVHRFIMGEKVVHTLAPSFFFNWTLFILAGIEDNKKLSEVFEFGQTRPRTVELSTVERLEKSQ